MPTTIRLIENRKEVEKFFLELDNQNSKKDFLKKGFGSKIDSKRLLPKVTTRERFLKNQKSYLGTGLVKLSERKRVFAKNMSFFNETSLTQKFVIV